MGESDLVHIVTQSAALVKRIRQEFQDNIHHEQYPVCIAPYCASAGKIHIIYDIPLEFVAQLLPNTGEEYVVFDQNADELFSSRNQGPKCESEIKFFSA